MSIVRMLSIRCDYKIGEVRCPLEWGEESEGHNPTTGAVRWRARANGWRRNDGIDLCPIHAPKEQA